MHAKPPPPSGRSEGRPGPRRGRSAGRVALRTLLGAGILLALLAALHALLWRWMGSQLEDGFAAWAASRRAQGWRVEHGPPERGGWPFAATLTLPRFVLAGGGATLPGGMEWAAEGLVLRLSPPRLDRLAVEMPGRHRLRLGALDLPFAADRLVATLPIERDVLPREAALEAERLRVGTAAGTAELRAARLEIETRITATEGEPAVTLRASGEEIGLPLALEGAGSAIATLGRTLQAVALDLALTGPVPPGRTPARKAEAWREGGGTLELRGLDLRWGPAAATVAATLTLDEVLQPMGAGTLRLVGGAELLEAAGAAGQLTPRSAATARTVLRLLSRTPPQGGPPTLEVPVTLEERSLTLARIPVLRLPEWRWPE
jgi:hypothetical protein